MKKGRGYIDTCPNIDILEKEFLGEKKEERDRERNEKSSDDG